MEKRVMLAMVLSVGIIMFFQMTAHKPQPEQQATGSQQQTAADSPERQPEVLQEDRTQQADAPAPAVAETGSDAQQPVPSDSIMQQSAPPAREVVVVEHPEYRLQLDTQGGCVTSWRLAEHEEIFFSGTKTSQQRDLQRLDSLIATERDIAKRALLLQQRVEIEQRTAALSQAESIADPEQRKKEVQLARGVELIPPALVTREDILEMLGPEARRQMPANWADVSISSVTSALVVRSGALNDQRLVYTASSRLLQVTEESTLELTAVSDSGLRITKRLTFSASRPEVDLVVETAMVPGGASDALRALTKWSLWWPCGLGFFAGDEHGTNFAHSMVEGKTKRWASTQLLKKGQQQIKAGELAPLDVLIPVPGQLNFLALENKYFVAALVPSATGQRPDEGYLELTGHDPGSRSDLDSRFGIGVVMRWPEPSPERPGTHQFTLFGGAKQFNQLKALGVGLEKIVFDSWFGMICLVMQWFIRLLYSIIPSYGLAIIGISVVTKMALYPLTHKQMMAMKRMQQAAPKVNEIKEKYKDNRQKQHEEIMKLYKQKGINPMGGCLPLLLQMPVFIALYVTIRTSIDLRGASFLWIGDLSQPDATFWLPFSIPLLGTPAVNILPLVMGVVTFLSQRKQTLDPQQKQMMTMMSVVFTFIMYKFSSGLVLYWLMNSLLQMVQQWLQDKFRLGVPSEEPASAAPAIQKSIGRKDRGSK